MTTSRTTYRTSNFELAMDLADAEGETLDLSALYDEHIRTAAAADLLIFDVGDDDVARMVKRPGARLVREYLGESAAA